MSLSHSLCIEAAQLLATGPIAVMVTKEHGRLGHELLASRSIFQVTIWDK